jgi:uncharacterized protein DUF6288
MRTVLLVLAGSLLAAAQDGKPPAPKKPVPHSSPDFRKCKKCLPAYEAALGYVKKHLAESTFPVKMMCAWLLMADGRYPNDVEQLVKTAMQWDAQRKNSQHAQNWYPALAGVFLAEYYKYAPTPDVQKGMADIVAEFVKTQERTGGWFKWFEGAYKDRLDYPVKDLGMLDSIILGFLHSAKTHGVKVPEDTLMKAEKCMDSLLDARGISYGTPQKYGEKTGARGSFLMMGLDFAGQRQHKVFKIYDNLLLQLIPNLDQGHHIGGFHCLGVVLGCHLLGPKYYDALIAKWLDHYLDLQAEDGSVYIGDDGDAGGEKGLLRGNVASTSGFALMILMQDQKVLRPPPPKGKKPAAAPAPKEPAPSATPTKP